MEPAEIQSLLGAEFQLLEPPPVHPQAAQLRLDGGSRAGDLSGGTPGGGTLSGEIPGIPDFY